MFRLSVRLCMVTGGTALVFAILCVPLMRDWLVSFDSNLKLFTVEEIAICRVVLILIGLTLMFGSVVWLAGCNASWRKNIEKDYVTYVENPSLPPATLSRFIWLWSAVTFFVMLALIQTMRWSFSCEGKGVGWYDNLTLESGVWETLTAITLAGAGIFFVVTACKSSDRIRSMPAKWPSLLLGILMLVGAGEEVSWGQHWLGFAVPESVKSINIQEELNLHNINTHLANHMMVFFFLFYIGILPVMSRLLSQIRYVFERVNIPLCPGAFAPFAFIGVLMGDHDLFSNLWGNPPWRISEARETLFGVIMLGVSISFYLTSKDRHSITES